MGAEPPLLHPITEFEGFQAKGTGGVEVKERDVEDAPDWCPKLAINGTGGKCLP